MYELVYADTAIKQLAKLEKEFQERIRNTLERCRIRPHDYAKRLVGSPYYSLRAGDYRIILKIEDQQLEILVIEIGHRRNIYTHL